MIEIGDNVYYKSFMICIRKLSFCSYPLYSLNQSNSNTLC